MKARTLATLAGVAAAFAFLVPAAQAETPAPGYEQFEGCPTKAENELMSSCLRAVIKSGKFKMGNKEVPIKNPIELRGGVDEELGHFAYTSSGGLIPVKEEVPGGIVGLTGFDWLIELLNAEQLKLYAVTELAGTPELHSLFEQTLPIKVHLINPVLGDNCYVGSNSNPIVLNLTTETSGKLTGKDPKFEFDFEKEILHANGGTYVDGLFSAPGANGCVLNLGIIPVNIDAVVNTASGLPSASGNNETVQNIDSEVVEIGLVYP